MLHCVKAVAKATGNRYGSRGMKQSLTGMDYAVGRHKARRLMKEAGVAVRHKQQFKVTTNSQPHHPVYDNLVKRDFTAPKPDHVYVAMGATMDVCRKWV